MISRRIRRIILVLLCVCSRVLADEAPQPSGMSQQIEGFNLQGYSDGGAKSWDIKGEKADIIGNTVSVTNVDANAYGDEDMNLTARTGVLNRTTGDVNLKENVVITAERGTVMKTDTLNWQRSNDLVKTADPVTIEDKSMHIQGIGMEAHPSKKDATLKSDVMADIKAESKDRKDNRIKITSDGPMELDQATSTAIFSDNVVAFEASSGRELKADRMEIHFDQHTKKISELICTGHVEVKQDNNITRSEELVYKADEQRMVLKGRPTLTIDPGDRSAAEAFKF